MTENTQITTTLDLPFPKDVIVRAIRALDPAGDVVSFDTGGKIHYHAVKQGRIAPSDCPEEHTRAFIAAYLVKKLGYSPAYVSIEEEIRARAGRKDKNKRCDLAVRDKSNRIHYFMEVKSPAKWYKEKASAVEGQLFGVSTFCEPSPAYLVYATVEVLEDKNVRIVSDIMEGGISHAKWEQSGGRVIGHELKAGWTPPEKLDYVCGGSNDLVANVEHEELVHIRRSLHNVLWGGGGAADGAVFDFLVRLLLAKIQDELETPQGEQYHVQDNAAPETVIARVNKRYQSALQARISYSKKEAEKERIVNLSDITQEKFLYAVNRIQKLHLTRIAETPGVRDILGDFFENIMRSGFKQSKGQFFTHPHVIRFLIYALQLDRMAVDMVNRPVPTLPMVIDPSAGSGAFLVETMKAITHAIQSGGESIHKTEQAEMFVKEKFGHKRKHYWAGNYCIGLELNSNLGLAAQANMVLHSDGSSAMLAGERGNGLFPFAKYPHTNVLHRTKDIENYDKLVNEQFDAVLTNPPFSLKIDSTMKEMLSDLRGAFSFPPDSSTQLLFVERWFQLLKPGGRLGAVLPNGVFDGRNNVAIREFIMRHFNVKAIISLPPDAFYPHTSTKTSLLIAEKKTDAERKAALELDLPKLLANSKIHFDSAQRLGFTRTTKGETLSAVNDLYDAGNGEVQNPDDKGILGKLRKKIKWEEQSSYSKRANSDANRVDAEYNLWISRIPPKRRALLSDFFDILSADELETPETPRKFDYCEIGDVSSDGSYTPEWVDMSVPICDDDKEAARLRKKIDGGSIMKPRPGDILAARVRIYLGKIFVAQDDNVYFSKDFVILRPKAENVYLHYLLLRGPLLPMMNAHSRWGSSYPVVEAEDLQSAIVDKQMIDGFLNSRPVDKLARKLEKEFEQLAKARQVITEVLRKLPSR